MTDKPLLPLLFLPGLLCDAALWQTQIDALGHPSYVPVLHEHDNITAIVDDILATAPPQFGLIGLSMGGYVAMEIMRRAPERVVKLALCDTTARPDNPEQISKRQALIKLAQTGTFKGVTPRLLPALLHPQALQNAAITSVITAMAARVGQAGFIRQQTAIMARVDSRPLLNQIQCPTLIMVGAQDSITPPELAHEMAALIPQARLAVIETCGHLPPLEQPEQATALLREWLAG